MTRRQFPNRREVIQALSAAVPSCILAPHVSWADDRVPLESPDDRVPRAGLLRVLVLPPEGRRLPPSVRVVVRIQGAWEELPRGASDRIYEKTVPTGREYEVRVATGGHLTIERRIAVNRAIAVTRVYLVPTGWSYYLAGGIEIPFEPRPRMAGVAIPRSLTAAEIARLNATALHEGFTPLAAEPTTGQKLDDVKRSVLYFQPTDPNLLFFSFAATPSTSHDRVTPDAVNRLKAIFSQVSGRVGSPVSLQAGKVRILDSRYVVKFASTVTEIEVRRFAGSLGATLIRQLEPQKDFWLIEFDDPQNLGRHLDAVIQQVRSGVLASGEPNLHFQLKAHGPSEVPRSIVRYLNGMYCQISNLVQLANPKDPYESCQSFLGRQRVRQAWCFLENRVPGGRYGLPSIHVASIDSGIVLDSVAGTSAHQDVRVTHLKYCYNVTHNQACTEEPDIGPDLHGMATYGIISGAPDNEFGITGIAPSAAHVAVDGSATIASPDRYSAMLLWVGGIACAPPDDFLGQVAPIPPADIINCSHGVEDHSVFDLIKDALRILTTSGRNGLGTVIVYSAGNEYSYLDENTLPTSMHTIGVANTEVIDGVESRWHNDGDTDDDGDTDSQPRGSNCSPFLDLCANGESAPSLSMDDQFALPGTPACRNSQSARKGVYIHGGTSSAAAMVSGAAALVLAINPKLSWRNVRDVLRLSAKKIDCEASSEGLDPNGLPLDGTWRELNPSDEPQQPCDGMEAGPNWYSDFYGYGRLDVYGAVKLAHGTLPDSLPYVPWPCAAR